MLRVIVNEGDKIDRALKQFKRKCNNTKLIQECRQRQEFEKPSVTARKKRLRAEYIQKLRNEEEL
jgi:small subunit ribosomal protein S21